MEHRRFSTAKKVTNTHIPTEDDIIGTTQEFKNFTQSLKEHQLFESLHTLWKEEQKTEHLDEDKYCRSAIAVDKHSILYVADPRGSIRMLNLKALKIKPTEPTRFQVL